MSGLHGNPRLIAHTYLWMLPIYGLEVFLEPLHDRIRPLPWYLRGLIWVLVIWLVELSTGGLIRAIIGTSQWIYPDGWQIAGLIRLDMAPLWFVTGFIFEQIHNRLMGFNLIIANFLGQHLPQLKLLHFIINSDRKS